MTLEEMKKIKDNRGYSFKTLSKYTGVPAVTLQKIFSGQTKHPRQTTLDAIEIVLKANEAQYPGKSYYYKKTGERPGRNSIAYVTREDAEYAGYLEKLNAAKNKNKIYSTSTSDDFLLSESLADYGSSAPNCNSAKDKKQDHTLADYYALPEDQRVELIDGTFYNMSAPSLVHQDISFHIQMAIYNYIKKNKGLCKVYAAPVDVQLDCDDKTILQPDLLLVCDRNKIKSFGIYGAPDFVLEILSKSTRKKDMTLKLYKYANAGVKEYWVIDPMKKILISYNFLDEEWIPTILPLKGRAGMAVFDNNLEIDLDEITEIIEE